jgi:3-hydroxyisobutyrate dehydrogenase-like beta-hydroxyacid dehydrogenase
VAELVIGVLHPGEMGAAVASALRARGHDVLWASDGRGTATARRAAAAGLRDAGTVAAMAAECDLILSVCPPHAATAVAEQIVGFTGVYVDANAVSPATARVIGDLVTGGGASFADGGIIGPPPYEPGTTRLYLSGAEAAAVAEAVAGSALRPEVVSARPGDASAVKMAYAAWSKGSAALLLAARALARSEGVEDDLVREWGRSHPELRDACVQAAQSATAKGWRWAGEMDEIAATHAAAGLPDGFHRAAGEVFARAPRLAPSADADEALELVLTVLAADPSGVTDSRR